MFRPRPRSLCLSSKSGHARGPLFHSQLPSRYHRTTGGLYTDLILLLIMSEQVDRGESRYEHLLATNEEPHDAEVAQLQKIIELHRSNLLQLDARIVELQETLRIFVERRIREEKTLSELRRIVSPIRRLPRDVLAEIFLSAQNWRKHTVGDYPSSQIWFLPKSSPLVLSHVCSKWRHVALSTHALWATIRSNYWYYDPSIPTSGPDRDEYLRESLARTGMHYPLNVMFIGPSMYMNSSSLPLSSMRPYMHRIKVLGLAGMLGSLPLGSFDTLEMLNLTNYAVDDAASISGTFFPSLRGVELEGGMHQFITPPFIPLMQLTHLFLHADSIYLDQFYDILSQSTALVQLHVVFRAVLGFTRDNHLIEVEEQPIVMTQLDALIVTEDSAFWLLSWLIAPALTTLNVTCVAWPTASFNCFRSRSSFSLHSLTLKGSYTMEPAEFFALVREMSSLIEITSNTFIDLTPVFVGGLSSPDLVPNLECLCIVPCHGSHLVEDNAFLEMINSRDSSGKPAVVVPNPSSSTRIFRSNAPKQFRGRLETLSIDEVVTAGATDQRKAVCIYF
ncbi:hypothetical protein Hypma_004088 [Hypsizygus marmoreus]|uniref:Uncharacterized protein n=1 Tax=Hypsizygus marmoreus TaxID=39966 RepID=A0A369JYM5_HYPMA|nr:hypothetical protein Hypma_004088 [Hypsizygus marmoreus]